MGSNVRNLSHQPHVTPGLLQEIGLLRSLENSEPTLIGTPDSVRPEAVDAQVEGIFLVQAVIRI